MRKFHKLEVYIILEANDVARLCSRILRQKSHTYALVVYDPYQATIPIEYKYRTRIEYVIRVCVITLEL